jgi:hypothetical protein
MTQSMTWTQTRPTLWLESRGLYAIVKVTLPEDRADAREEFILRRCSPARGRITGTDLGYPVDVHVSLEHAKTQAENHRFWLDSSSERRQMLDDCGADADHATTFFFPISDGTDRAALVIKDGVAKVVSPSRASGDSYRMGAYAELPTGAA